MSPLPCFSVAIRLEDLGYGAGHRLLEILYFRERGSKRDVRLLDILRFIHSTLWRYLFNRQARDLEQSNTVSNLHNVSVQHVLKVQRLTSVPTSSLLKSSVD